MASEAEATARAELSALRPELHRYCARLMGSVIDGEDVVQDAYLRALAALAERKPETPLRPWLFRIAHNRALDLLKSRAVRRSEAMETTGDIADETTPDPAEHLLRKDAVRLAIARFTELPLLQRSALILKDVLDEPIADIAALLELSVDAVKAHLARGRARLRVMAETPVPEFVRSPISAETERYAVLFNGRDWEALRALLAKDAKLQQSSYPLRTDATVRQFFTIYSSYGDVRLIPGWLEEREVLAVFEGASTRPNHIMWLSWQDGLIDYIRDYRYVAYVLSEAELTLTGPWPKDARP